MLLLYKWPGRGIMHNTVYSSIIQYNTVQYSTVPDHTAQRAVAHHPLLLPGGHTGQSWLGLAQHRDDMFQHLDDEHGYITEVGH